MQQKIKKAYISLDLLLDYNSYIFCIARSYLWQNNVQIENSYRKNTELQNLKSVFDLLNKKFFQNEKNFENFNSLYKNYLLSLKPQIGAIDFLKILQSQNYQLYSSTENYTELNDEIEEIKNANKSWFDSLNIETNSKNMILQGIKNNEENFDLIVSGDIEFLQSIRKMKEQSLKSDQKSTLLYVQNSDFHNEKHMEEIKNNNIDILCTQLIEDIDFCQLFNLDQSINYEFPEKEYYLKLKEYPKDVSFEGFGASVPLQNQINIKSKVIKGQGKAGAELGIYTANLDIKDNQNQEIIKSLPTGVYNGKSILHKQDGSKNTYDTLFFIGSSQYFQTPMKQLECYLYNEFDDKFYDQELEIFMNEFQRPEADFKSFDHLIKTMHNDVWQGRKATQQQNGVSKL